VIQGKAQFCVGSYKSSGSIVELIILYMRLFYTCIHYHKSNYKAENCFHISRWHLKHYKETFSGSALVDWLLGVGLARDRNQAAQYARHLLEGRVIRHVENLYHFHDQTMLYTFVSIQDRY
jgi:hypothetical protein